MKRETMFQGFFRVERITTDEGLVRDIVLSTDSVNLLVYDKSQDRVLLVKQVRESQIRDDNPAGFITETIAGRFDVDLGVKALAVKEAKEEAGVKVTEDRIVVLNQGVPMALSAGILAERAYLCYVEVTEEDFEQEERSFGTDAGEHVRRVWIPVSELKDYVCEDVRVYGLIRMFQGVRFRNSVVDEATKSLMKLRRRRL